MRNVRSYQQQQQQPYNPRRSPSVSPPTRRGRSLGELEQAMSAYTTSSALASMIGDLRTATVKRPTQQHGLGFHIRGGRELGLGIYISKVETNSNAEKSGLRAGDQIISVNGKSFESITHQEALRILRSFSTLHLTLCATGRVPSTCVLYQTYTWVDRHGRRVSPPDEYDPQFHRSSSTWSLYSIGKSSKLRKVTLSLEEGESLGLMIRGGTEYGLGIYITGVDPESAADRANLQIGDQILEVNEVSFEDITHDEAVRILKHSKHLVMMILDVGKIPFSCTMYDEMHWGVPGVDDDDQSELSTEDGGPYFTTADPEILRILNEKARLLLTKKEHASMTYYHTEYDRGLMTLDAFVAVLLEILNTTDKFSLLAEIRELIPVNDREKFDDLIYSREFEMKKTCQKLGSSMEHLAADRKADRARRNTYAQCYRYADMDKNTGKILRHNECFDSVQPHRQSLSGTVDHRRKSSMYDSPRRTLSASTQALFYGGEDPYGDELRTPSEDSGVDLANGLHYGSRLPVERAATAPSLLRSGHQPGVRGGRRVASRTMESTSSQQRRGRIGGWDDGRSSVYARCTTAASSVSPSFLQQSSQSSSSAAAQQRRLPAVESRMRGRESSSAERQRSQRSVATPFGRSVSAHPHLSDSNTQAPQPPPSIQSTATASAASAADRHSNASFATSFASQANRRQGSSRITPAGLQQDVTVEGHRSTATSDASGHLQEQTFAGDRNRGWNRHSVPITSHHQHPPSRGGSGNQRPEGGSRHSGRGWTESEGTVSSSRGQPYHGGVCRPLPPRSGTDRRRDEETYARDETVVHNAEPRRQTMRSDSRELDTTGAVTVPRRLQQQQPPLQPPPRPRLA